MSLQDLYAEVKEANILKACIVGQWASTLSEEDKKVLDTAIEDDDLSESEEFVLEKKTVANKKEEEIDQSVIDLANNSETSAKDEVKNRFFNICCSLYMELYLSLKLTHKTRSEGQQREVKERQKFLVYRYLIQRNTIKG